VRLEGLGKLKEENIELLKKTFQLAGALVSAYRHNFVLGGKIFRAMIVNIEVT
jgi:hypothetical protein